MVVKGYIVEVMESYPPQLIVDVAGRMHYIGLTETTQVSKEGQVAEWGELRPNVRIVAEGERTGTDETAMIAMQIQLF